MNRFLMCTSFWLIAFHWWVILRLVPGLRDLLAPLGFKQALYWINIPGVPLARMMGPKHFGIEEFGAIPAGPLEYTIITFFWIFVAVVLGCATSAFWSWLTLREQNEKNIQQGDST